MGRAQISIFIIIGIAIVFIASIFIYKSNEAAIRNMLGPGNKDQTAPVKDFVQSCLRQTTREALYRLGEQGRVYPDAYLLAGEEKISYFYFQGKDYFPAISQDELEVSRFVRDNIRECVSGFKRSGYIIKEDIDKIDAAAVFENNSLKIRLTYPMEVYTGGEKKDVGEFSDKAYIRFPMLHELSERIYTEAKGNPEWIDLDYSDYPFEVSIVKLNQYTYVYEITDMEYGLDSKPYTYRFAIKYGL